MPDKPVASCRLGDVGDRRVDALPDAAMHEHRRAALSELAGELLTQAVGRARDEDRLVGRARGRNVQVSIETSVPIGVYGQISAEVASGSSTQPRLCGVPNDARSKL